MASAIEVPDVIVLDHGGGGRMAHELVTSVIAVTLGPVYLGEMQDSAILPLPGRRIAMTTDSFVIDPIFFGNGDIGRLCVCGTVNDLAVSGACPRYLTLALILEEGFPIRDLERILDSARQAAEEAGVGIVAGDTKVVRRGEAHKIFINTAGVGCFGPGRPELTTARILPGDRLIVSGELGNHAIHVLSLREGLGFETRVLSDCAPLNGLIDVALAEAGADVHCMRDLTRGGLGATVTEINEATGLGIQLREAALPVQTETAMAADMLGLTPLHLANEGNVCIFVAPRAAEAVVERLRGHRYGTKAAIVGEVGQAGDKVVMVLPGGRTAVVPALYKAELPRLC